MNKYQIINDNLEIPVISIAMLTFNHQDFIVQALEGVLMQNTDFNFKIIVADDKSTDNTRNILLTYQKNYPNKFKLILQNDNVGVHENTLSLIENVEGKYIALCEGDDYWFDSSKLQKQVDFLEHNPEYVLSFHDVQNINFRGALISESKIPRKNQRNLSSKEMCGSITLPTLSLVFRNKENLFKFKIEDVLNGDKVLISYLSEYGKSKFHPEIKNVFYRSHDNGIWSSLNNEKQLVNNYRTFLALSQHKFKYQKVLRKNALLFLFKLKKINEDFYNKEIQKFYISDRVILAIKISILKFSRIWFR